MAILIYKNILSGNVLFVETPKPEKRIHAMAIGIISNEMGVKYPRIYSIPVAISDEDFKKIEEKKELQLMYTDIVEFNSLGINVGKFISSNILSKDDVEYLFPHLEGYINITRSKIFPNIPEDSLKSYIRRDIYRSMSGKNLPETLGLIGRPGLTHIADISIGGVPINCLEHKDSLFGITAIVLQKIRVDCIESDKFNTIKKTLFEKGEVVLLQQRGPYKPVIHSINNGEGVLSNLKLYKKIDIIPGSSGEELNKKEFLRLITT